MKKLITLFLILAMLLPIAVLAEDLTDLEKEYLGGWVMYATHGSAVYHYTLTFTSEMKVISHTIRIVGGKVLNDNTASGIWGEFSTGIVFSLAGKDFKGKIHEDGYLFISELYEKENASGVYSKCPDMSFIFD